MKTSEYKAYLKRLLKAFNMDESELNEFDAMIQKDYNDLKRKDRIKQGEEILNSIK